MKTKPAPPPMKPHRGKPAKQPPAPPPPARNTRTVADQQLASIRAWAHANHGSILAITTEMQRLTDEPITRQTVGRWLHKDPAKRREPSYGAGILLEMAVMKLQTAGKQEANPEPA